MSTSNFVSLPNAGLSRRLTSLVYELLLLVAVSLAYNLAVWLIRSAIEGSLEGHGVTSTPASIVIMTGWWLALASYFNYSWAKRGQTLAMKAWRLRLQQPNGTLASAKQRWCRTLLAPLSWISIVGILWVLWDKNAGCLHDKLTGTRVVLLPKGVN